MSCLRLLIISNGHGEDVVGARLAEGLARTLPWLEIEAFPLVGLGSAYQEAGVAVSGPRKALPAAGLTLHHYKLFTADIAAGLLPLTFAQLRHLRRARPAAVLVVGDAYAQALAELVAAPRRVLQPLVSIKQSYDLTGQRLTSTLWHRAFMERIRAPERWLMSRADKVYTRDSETAAWLRSRGIEQAVALGNPVMDGLDAAPLSILESAAEGTIVVAMLPGSRGYATRSLRLMARALMRLASSPHKGGAAVKVRGLVAWAPTELPAAEDGWLSVEEPATLATAEGAGGAGIAGVAGVAGVAAVWRPAPTKPNDGTVGERNLVAPDVEILFVRQQLAAVLASSEVVLGTAGTANEQAAGRGLPVISFAVEPEYGSAFLANQERLLGGAMRVVEAEPAALAEAVMAAGPGSAHRRTAAVAGPQRMGPPGGTAALVADLSDWLGVVRLRQ